MKKRLLKSMFLLCICWASTAQTNDITFKVDLTPLNDPNAVAHIAGDFNSWTVTPMTHEGNNLYTITYTMTGGWSGNGFNFLSSTEWSDAEPAFEETCGGDNANSGKTSAGRWFYKGDEAGGQSITYAYVWGSCTNPLVTQVSTTFQVDISSVLDTAQTPANYGGYISGDFNSYTIEQMTDVGEGVYEITLDLNENSSGDYFYLITNAGDFSGREPSPSSVCRDGENRSYSVATSSQTIKSLVGSCASKVSNWTGTTSSDWFVGTNWSDGNVPDNTCDVTISTSANDPEINGTVCAVVNGLTIDNGASLDVMTESSLVIRGKVSNNGSYSYSRNLQGGGSYSAMGSPVSGVTVSDLSVDFCYGYNGSGNSYEAKLGTDVLSAGAGYFLAQNQAEVIKFSGTPNSLTVTQSVLNTEFALVSNPYGAAISASAFLEDNDEVIEGTLYFWDDGGSNVGNVRGGDFVTLNAVGMTTSTNDLGDGVSGVKGTTPAADGMIGSTQAFFVKATADGTVSFNPDIQVTTSGSNDDASFYRKENAVASEFSWVKLALSGNGLYNEIMVAYHEQATTKHDYGWDAHKFSGNKNISFYSMGGSDARYTIQALPNTYLSNGEVQLRALLSNPGSYQIRIVETNNLKENVRLFISEGINSTEHLLSQNSSFEFKIDANHFATSPLQFHLRNGMAEVLSIDESEFNLSIHADYIDIYSSVAPVQQVSIHAIDGKVLLNENVVFESNKAQLDIKLVPNRIYIIKVGEVTRKLIIK